MLVRQARAWPCGAAAAGLSQTLFFLMAAIGQVTLARALAALGVMYGGFVLTGLAVATAPKDKPGFLSGLNGACFGIGASLGIALASAMITAGSDANGVTEAGATRCSSHSPCSRSEWSQRC
ncbi:hypothetical protein [Streptomyces wuyuanensis]|uniref:hypothetical protein n=1 Tax=Streptomyces wuyuanensis TaxID=1196353 RepID=UPI00371C0630